MSTFFPYELRCGCGEVQTVDLVAGIHISRLPDARRRILDGTFQVFACPSCGRTTRVESPTVYTDFDHDQYVAVECRVRDDWPAVRARHTRIFDDAFRAGPAIASEMGVRFRKRAVVGFAALREKLLLWDHGLDDLVVEALKGDLLAEAGIHPGDAVLRVASVLDGGHLLFGRFDPIGRADPDEAGVRVEHERPVLDLHTALADRYADRLFARTQITADLPWLADDWLVDVHDGLAALTEA